MADELDPVWKALSDPTRRKILDLLRPGSMTTTEIVESFPDMTRHAVMKHIDVLREANLINTREDGRRRINSLNVVPIRQIYERYVGPFAELTNNFVFAGCHRLAIRVRAAVVLQYFRAVEPVLDGVAGRHDEGRVPYGDRSSGLDRAGGNQVVE